MTTTTADQEISVVSSVPHQLHVGGRWRDAEGGRTFGVEDPATGAVLAEVADASPADGRAALDAAVAAQPGWARVPARERAEILRRAFELVLARQEDLALLMTLEMGKPLAQARGEVQSGAEFLRWFSEEACRIDGGFAAGPEGETRLLVMKQPVGPALLITPWNFPLSMGTRKIAPALAAGCTAVVKPAPQTPLSMLALAEIFAEAGVPDGVCNVVPTSDAGALMEPLIRDGRARKLSFTGSTAVGRRLLAQAADQVLKVSMELGGNAPFLVFPDADVDAAVDAVLLAKMRNMGEACTAANRIYVHADLAPAFGEALAARIAAERVGRGTEDGVTIGPLIEGRAVDKVTGLVRDATERGAKVVVGGEPVDGPGHFFAPTLISDVPVEARMTREEIFGPVAPITPFTDEDAVVAAANDTEYGLVSYVFTTNLDRALRVCERLESGMVALNRGVVANPAAPFGGVKHSGLGREGGRIGIEEFLETKYVSMPAGG